MQTSDPIKENDVVTTLVDVVARTLDDDPRDITMPAGTKAAVVMVYAPNGTIEAFELEFHLSEEDEFAMATVPAHQVRLVWAAAT